MMIWECLIYNTVQQQIMILCYAFGRFKKVVFSSVMHVLSNFQLGGMSSSQVGVWENALVCFQHGYISRKRYWFMVIKSHLYEQISKK